MTDLCFNWYNLMMKTNKIMKTEAKVWNMRRSEEGPDQRVMYWLLILAWCFHIVGRGNQISRRRPGHDYQYTMDRHSLTNQQSQSLLLQDFSSQTRKAVFFFFLFNPCGRDWTQLICLIYNDRNQFNQRDKSTNRGLILLIYNLSWSKTSERQLICFVNE